MEEVGGGQATIAGCLGWWVGVRVTELNALVWMPGSWNACAGGVAGWWVRGGMRMRSASKDDAPPYVHLGRVCASRQPPMVHASGGHRTQQPRLTGHWCVCGYKL
jgi:hypothetical protein